MPAPRIPPFVGPTGPYKKRRRPLSERWTAF